VLRRIQLDRTKFVAELGRHGQLYARFDFLNAGSRSTVRMQWIDAVTAHIY
jgi:hypothetical protein